MNRYLPALLCYGGFVVVFTLGMFFEHSHLHAPVYLTSHFLSRVSTPSTPCGYPEYPL